MNNLGNYSGTVLLLSGSFTLAALTGDGSVIVSGIGLVECCVIFASVVRVYGIIVVLVSVWYIAVGES